MAEAEKRVRTRAEPHAGLAHLNAAQVSAVAHEGGPLLVIAGAGTGKTAVITERIAWLIREKGYRPDSILALTFTERAAGEMEERVDQLLPMGYTQVWIETFHGFCERILRDWALEIGLDPAFRVLSGPEQWLLLRRHLFALPLRSFRPLGNPTKFLRSLLHLISAAKDQDLPPERFEDLAGEAEDAGERAGDAATRDALREDAARWREVAAVTRAYNAILLRESAMDFGDLILNALRLLRERPSVRQRLREQFRAVLVDEFQDTNGAQNELLRLLVGEGGGNVTVVGDDDQSIYAWRGSNITNILKFQETYSSTKNIVLTENYRSPQVLLDAAYQLIQQNNPLRLEKTADVVKKLASARTFPNAAEEQVIHRHFPTREQESAYIADAIVEFVERGTYGYRDCVILTRTNAQADDVVPSLIQRDIPYHVAEARGLLLRPEIRDVCAYLRVVANPEDTASLFRIISLPVFGVEPFSRQRLLDGARRRSRALIDHLRDAEVQAALVPDSAEGVRRLLALIDRDVARAPTVLPSHLLLEFLQKSGVLERTIQSERQAAEALPNLTEFLHFVQEVERSAEDASLMSFVEFLTMVAASGESPAQATLPADVDAVRVLTVHGAKGLEFPVVFLPGATADKYPVRDRRDLLELPEAFAPHLGVDPRDAHVLEERRLFYVAITRAQERLIITSAERVGSQKLRRKPSPFIQEAGIRTVEGRTVARGQQLLLPMTQAPPPVAPSSTLGVPTAVSASQIETYETCPLQYEFRYVYRVPVPPHHALTFGTTVHAVLRDLARLVTRGETPTSADVERLYEQHWNPQGYESAVHAQEQKARGRELLLQYLAAHPELLTKHPLFVEEPFRFRVGDVTVAGRVDRVDETTDGQERRVVVTDFKTGTPHDQKTADADLQLSMYALALREVFHLHADRLTLSYLDGNVDRQTARTDEDLEGTKERVLAVATRIRERAFPPTPSVHACRFCEFRTICDFSAV